MDSDINLNRIIQIWYSNLKNGIVELLKEGTITPKTTVKELLKIVEEKL